MRKPTLSVRIVNQLYEDERELMDALLGVAKKLKKSLDAREEQKALLARAHDAAAKVSQSKPILQRVDTTLRALSVLGTWAPDRPGLLTADREPVGFEVAFGAPMPVKRAQPRKKPDAAAEAKRAKAEAKRAAAEAKRVAAEARRAAAKEAKKEARRAALRKQIDAVREKLLKLEEALRELA